MCHCKKAFNQKTDLKNHLNTHQTNTPLKCSLYFRCVESERLTSKKNGEKTYNCQICKKKIFARTGLLRVNGYRHRPNNSVSCPVCNEHFVTKIELKQHMSTHSGSKPIACQICGISLTTKAIFRKHTKLLHPRIKEHICNICDKLFKAKNN